MYVLMELHGYRDAALPLLLMCLQVAEDHEGKDSVMCSGILNNIGLIHQVRGLVRRGC